MATVVLTDASVTIDGNDFSTQIDEISIEASAAVLEDTTMGATGRTKKAGLLEGSVTFSMFHDYADAGIDDLMWALLIARANVTFVGKPTSAAVSATNPSFSGSVVPEASRRTIATGPLFWIGWMAELESGGALQGSVPAWTSSPSFTVSPSESA